MTTRLAFWPIMTSMSVVPNYEGIPSPIELERIAIDTTRAAAAIVKAGYGSATSLRSKSSPTDIVTQTDLDSENLVRQLLSASTPHAGLLGEEGGGTNPGQPLQWIIDPLDGTINFLYGVPIFAVSIAAAVQGVVVAGAVIDVLRQEVFSAHVGGGARLNGEPIQVAGCDDLTKALIATGFSYRKELRERQGRITHELLPRVRDVRAFGSAALECCWVACGRVNGYFERDIKLWDYAAGALIATEAGALAELPCPENADLVVTAAPGIFSALRALLQDPSP
jgi:myo-inositol-1(or 4)-monophosphatase